MTYETDPLKLHNYCIKDTDVTDDDDDVSPPDQEDDDGGDDEDDEKDGDAQGLLLVGCLQLTLHSLPGDTGQAAGRRDKPSDRPGPSDRPSKS